MKKNGFKVAIWYVAFIAVVIVAIALLYGGSSSAEELKYSDIIAYFEDGKVQSYDIDYNKSTLTLVVEKEKETGKDEGKKPDKSDKNDYVKLEYKLADINTFLSDIEEHTDGIEEYDRIPAKSYPWWLGYLPYVIIAVVFMLLWWYMMSQATGGKGSKINSFGKAKTKAADKSKIFFQWFTIIK